MQFERRASDLEAQALRSQMNPHFIFNCLNSIKLLIQGDDKPIAIEYLTTFSKLIRKQMNNNLKEIPLYEELETCKLYLELELLRFGSKINYTFNVSDAVDLHSVFVPPLILQPFIENAIWHGILPKPDGGSITISVTSQGENVECIIDDNGIRREKLLLIKSQFSASHESKGIELIKNRINLYNLMNNRKGFIKVIDKKNELNEASGTTVIINFGRMMIKTIIIDHEHPCSAALQNDLETYCPEITAGILPINKGMRIINKRGKVFRIPVIAPRGLTVVAHSLLNYRPVAAAA